MVKIDLRGDTWKVYVWEQDHYERKFPGIDAGAIVNFEHKHMYINRDDCSLITLRHELFHVYASYCYLKSTVSLKESDIEEVHAEMFAHEAPKILAQANYLYRVIKEKH
jgi:hypothetical protein